jgi:peptidoglycan/LPS O-acetylase OafA/YrhL
VELNDLRHFVLNLFFASNWGWQRGFSFNAPVWSVSLELLVYVFFFVTTYLFGISFFMAILWLAACLLLDNLLGYEGVFVRCLFYFYVGGLTCLCYQFIQAKFSRYRILFTLAAAILVVGSTRRFEATHDLDLWLLDCAVPMVLLIFALNSNLLENRLGAIADGLGNLTYASYLIHFPFQLLVMLLVGALSIDHRFAASPFFLGFYLISVLVLSHFVYRLFEMPAQTLIRRRFASNGKGDIRGEKGLPVKQPS